jgi:hypothetical protein
MTSSFRESADQRIEDHHPELGCHVVVRSRYILLAASLGLGGLGEGGEATFAQTNVTPGQSVSIGVKITPGLVADNKPPTWSPTAPNSHLPKESVRSHSLP